MYRDGSSLKVLECKVAIVTLRAAAVVMLGGVLVAIAVAVMGGSVLDTMMVTLLAGRLIIGVPVFIGTACSMYRYHAA